MPNARKWSNEQVFQMFSKWEQGWTLREIGAELGISGTRVSQLIHRILWRDEVGYPGHESPTGEYCLLSNKWIWQQASEETVAGYVHDHLPR